jgi:hypothetical protein
MLKKSLKWWNTLPNNYSGHSKGGLATKYGFGNKQSISDLTNEDIIHIWKHEKPKKPKKRFTKKDLDNAFYAGKARRFDTGVELNPYFEVWYKRYTKKD